MAKAGGERNTQQPTGGKGAGFRTKRQNITKDDHVNQDALLMDDFNSFTTDQMPMDDFIEMDDLSSINTEKMPMDDDFIELDDLSGINTGKFGSFFDGQYSPALGRKEAAMNEPPVQYELQWEDYNNQIKFSSSKHYSLNKLQKLR